MAPPPILPLGELPGPSEIFYVIDPTEIARYEKYQVYMNNVTLAK